MCIWGNAGRREGIGVCGGRKCGGLLIEEALEGADV